MNNVDNKPSEFNAVLADGEVATVAQLSDIDTLNGSGTISANVSTTAADLLTYLTEADSNDAIDDLLSQATNIAITSYTGQNLSPLSNVTGSTTFELVLSGDTTITHAQAAFLNVVDKITVTGDSGTTTLSGESFTPNTASTHFGSLATIETSGSSNVLAIADYGDEDDGSTIDLKQLETVSGFSSVTVTGDTGVNIIQLSVALTTSGTTSVDLVSDDAVDRLILNTDPDEDSNSYMSSGSSLGYTTVSNFDATGDRDKFGLYYGDTSALSQYKTASSTGDGVVAVSADRFIVENDGSPTYSSGTDGFDSASEIKTMVANAVTSVDDSADRLALIQYSYDADADQTDTYIIGAELEGARGETNLESDDSFTVVPIARLLSVGGDDNNAIAVTNTANKRDADSLS